MALVGQRAIAAQACFQSMVAQAVDGVVSKWQKSAIASKWQKSAGDNETSLQSLR